MNEELLARLDEAEALIASLRQRNVQLNVEIRRRDSALAEIKKELAEIKQSTSEGDPDEEPS